MTILEALFGTKQEADLKKLLPILNAVNEKESWAMSLKASDFPAKTAEYKALIASGTSLDKLLPEAFALAREAARRTLGERLYDVQLLGAISLHQGRIMEMKTGEGKTVSCVPAAYLNSLEGKGVHVVTVNDYLAERDALWMKPIFDYLDVSVGYIIGPLEQEARLAAYRSDITYGTNNEFGFDYLRDNMSLSLSAKLQQHHHYCIIDEIDSILIDEARTPLIISGQAEEDTRKYTEANKVVRDLVECVKDPTTGDYPDEPVGDYKLEEKNKRVSFTDQGLGHAEEILLRNHSIKGTLFDPENFEYIHLVTQAMRAHKLFHLDTEYVVKEGQVQIVDEFTGRILHGRRYSDGLHQAIEAKEGIKVAQRNRTLATITFQNFFRMYNKISGMTGTAETEAKEFGKIYGLDVVVVPTNRPVSRVDEDDLIFLNEHDKYEAICDEIQEAHKKGQPVLVGTVSIEKSERLSNALARRGVRHEVLNAKNHAREATIVAEAGAKGGVVIATNMAGRGTDIKLGGSLDFRARKKAGSDASPEELQQATEEERLKWIKDFEEVCSVGGLYIIGTERHESRRIDNQLRGRSGRQGDPGRSRFFLSLDDDLMRLFGGGASNLKSMLSRVGMKQGEALNHPMLNRAIERAQNKVEERNFDIRKHLLDFDDVLNEQRKFIYEQRDSILVVPDVRDRVLATLSDVMDEALAGYRKSRGEDHIALADAFEQLKQVLYVTFPGNTRELVGKSADEVRDLIVEHFKAELDAKAQLAGIDQLTMFLRYEYLRNIDARWQDHLENLEALREAVYLRSYAQKNPLLEYKIEGFEIFDDMLYEIRLTVARRALLLRIETPEQATISAPRSLATAAATARHSSVSAFEASGAGPQRPSAAPGNPATTQMRAIPKVGRNDPCPCGSGKKYKHCHGA